MILLAMSAALSLDLTHAQITSTFPGISLMQSYTSPIRFAKNLLKGVAPDSNAFNMVRESPINIMYTFVIAGVTSCKADEIVL